MSRHLELLTPRNTTSTLHNHLAHPIVDEVPRYKCVLVPKSWKQMHSWRSVKSRRRGLQVMYHTIPVVAIQCTYQLTRSDQENDVLLRDTLTVVLSEAMKS